MLSSDKFSIVVNCGICNKERDFLNLSDRPSGNAEDSFILKLLSFNILAQNLLETHSYLYMHHNPTALSWKVRKPLVLQEIFESEANVCTCSPDFNYVQIREKKMKR